MAKSPHTPEFRAKVSQEYLDGVGSYYYISAKYSLGMRSILFSYCDDDRRCLF